MKMPLLLFPTWTVKQYNLTEFAKNGWVHIKMRHLVWGLVQAGILVNKRLHQNLAPFGYIKCVSMPSLWHWHHESRPISFTLVVDDFGIKYVNKEDVDHLIMSIKTTYLLTKDWTGNLYCSIALKWDYKNDHVNISMSSYIKKKMQEYGHVTPKQLQPCPYSLEPKLYGSDAHAPLPPDATPKLDAKGVNCVQQIVGSILYYARVVNMTVLMALSFITMEQTKATERTLAWCLQLFDYLVRPEDAKVRYHASDMIMNIHPDVLYLSKEKARSRACRHFFLGWLPKDDEFIQLNGGFHVSMTILRFVVTSPAEAELGALYHNCQTGIIF